MKEIEEIRGRNGLNKCPKKEECKQASFNFKQIYYHNDHLTTEELTKELNNQYKKFPKCGMFNPLFSVEGCNILWNQNSNRDENLTEIANEIKQALGL